MVNLCLALGTMLAIVLGCSSTKEPEWTKAKILAEGLESPSAVTTDENFVYFVTGGHLASLQAGTSGVWKIPRGGGQPVLLFKGYQKNEKTVVMPDTFVLASDEKYVYFAAGHIYRIPKGGGEAEQIAPGSPTEMVLDEENIYWHDYVGEGMSPTPAYTVGKKGGPVRTLTDAVTVLAIAVDKEFFYWAQPDGIYRLPKSGGEKTRLVGAKNNGRITGMTTDPQAIYFLDGDELFMVGKAGGQPVKITSGVNYVHQFHVDASDVYFIKNEGSFGTSLNRVSKNGGEVTRIDGGYLRSFTVGKDSLYVSDGSRVFELAK